MSSQSTFFKGIYDFEDPSGCLVAAKVPAIGSVDLYSGTAVIVRPNQTAIFVYKGQIADVLGPGTHEVKTDNLPFLSRLANWRFGFESPLRAELVFFSNHIFTSRRWGTPQPVIVDFGNFGSVPMRSFGNFSVTVKDPRRLYGSLMGTRSVLSITDIEELIQSQIVELIPKALQDCKDLQSLAMSYGQIANYLQAGMQSRLESYGLRVEKVQVLSALPSKEVIEAMEAKTAIQIIGSQKEYLLYKAATSLGQPGDNHGNDPMQMMMGMMLGKGLAAPEMREASPVAIGHSAFCSGCGKPVSADARFCAGCGKKII